MWNPHNGIIFVIEIVRDKIFAAKNISNLFRITLTLYYVLPHLILLSKVVEGVICGTRIYDLITMHFAIIFNQVFLYFRWKVYFCKMFIKRYFFSFFNGSLCCSSKTTDNNIENILWYGCELIGYYNVCSKTPDLSSITHR